MKQKKKQDREKEKQTTVSMDDINIVHSTINRVRITKV